jgi:hypothetical protein
MNTLEELEAIRARHVEDKAFCVVMRIEHPPQIQDIATLLRLLDAAREELREVEILKRLAPEYYQWPGKAGAELAPEWLQHRLKYGGANVDGDMLAVYDWHDRRSLAAPGDYVVDGEKGLYVLVNARAALKGT